MPNRTLLLFVALSLASASPALAVDGVIELNQACAVNTGCGPGDTRGYPITVRRGSYRLTGELQMPATATLGIEVQGSPTTIDFNGFSLVGDPFTPQQKGVGQSTATPPGFVTIRNGALEDLEGICIELGDYSRVENMQLIACGLNAIVIGDHGHVLANTIQGSVGQELVMGEGTLYRDNVIDEGLDGAPVSGGIAGGVNTCGEEACGSPPMRRFFLTAGTQRGSRLAPSFAFCGEGFHIASFWEIADVSHLRYDTARGRTEDDAGEGPPAGERGWVRTGGPSEGFETAGRANCELWRETSPREGTTVELSSDWTSSSLPSEFEIWSASKASCSQLLPVWCVQD